MHDFLKKIFGTGKPAQQVSLAFESVPGWLTERESAAKETLVTGTREPMNAIRNGIAGLRLVVNNIAGAEQDQEIHPKLRSIAKNSLPQFVRAMKSSLAKDLPEDPVEFYPAAAECVKGCINNARGQGRYLQAIFPEEMKEIRQGIDVIGRGINTINPLLAAYRKEMAEVAAARSLFDAALDLQVDLKKSGEKETRAHVRIEELEQRRSAIDTTLAAFPEDPLAKEVGALRDALADIGHRKDEASRTYFALSMTASHIFRKAEKIATKQRRPAEIAILNTAMDVLSDHEIPDAGRLDAALAEACPVAERMVAAGEVALKNKEERAVFSDTRAFRDGVSAAVSALHVLESRHQQAEAALSRHPVVARMQSLEREKAQISAMLEKEEQMLHDLLAWKSGSQKRLPELLEELKEKIAGMSGGNAHLLVPDSPSP